MFRYSTPCSYKFNTVAYTSVYELMCSDRNMSGVSLFDRTFDRMESISYGVQQIVDLVGYNPFMAYNYKAQNYSSNYDITALDDDIKNIMSGIGLDYDFYYHLSDGELHYTESAIAGELLPDQFTSPASNTGTDHFDCTALNGSMVDIYPIDTNKYVARVRLYDVPERYYDHDDYDTTVLNKCKYYDLFLYFGKNSYGDLRTYEFRGQCTVGAYSIPAINQLPQIEPEADVANPNDPYSYLNGGASGTGGGDGDGGTGAGVDSIEKAEVPPLPTLSATSAGFITIYNPSQSQLVALADYLWSNAFDIDTFKKLFSDPMEAIIGLGIIPVNPSIGGSRAVKFGSVTTSVSMPYLGSQWVEKSMGSVSIRKYIGSFMDYEPYVKVSLYLPYIGFHELSADDVMNDTISVTYHVDCLTGGCTAFVYVGDKGIMYQYSGSCITNVPLTAINWSTAIQNAVSAATSGAMVIAGVATGAAPLTAMGAMGLAGSAANTALNSKPTVQRSGAMGGSSGLMGYQRPMIVITRPRISIPDKMSSMYGNCLNATMRLGKCKGFTMVEQVHLDGVPCTEKERDELQSLLKKGVIF